MTSMYYIVATVHSSTVGLLVETQAAKSGVALDTADVMAPGSLLSPWGRSVIGGKPRAERH